MLLPSYFLNLSTGSSGGRVIGHELTNSSAEKNSDEPNYFNAAGAGARSRLNSRSVNYSSQKKRGASNSKTIAATKKGRKEILEEDDDEEESESSDDYFEEESYN